MLCSLVESANTKESQRAKTTNYFSVRLSGGNAMNDLPVLVENEQDERLISVSVQLLSDNACVSLAASSSASSSMACAGSKIVPRENV
jgi:hypothetical protein